MTTRYIYDVELAPLFGSTFQPTGFPDIGAATFTKYEDGREVDALLVESVQSMANRLEATAWNRTENRPVDTVAGLPWVEVVSPGSGEFLTSSRLEAHRLASAYIRTAQLDGTTMGKVIAKKLDLPTTPKDHRPLNYTHIATEVAKLDPFCLVHGVWFSHGDWYGQPRLTRALSAVIEAHHVKRAVSGGRMTSLLHHKKEQEGEHTPEGNKTGAEEGLVTLPYSRIEWTAKRIVASFTVDVELLGSYGLPKAATEALETLALWEIRNLLDGGLRLRTACDLEQVSPISARFGPELPTANKLTTTLRGLIAKSKGAFGDGKAITVEWSGKKG